VVEVGQQTVTVVVQLLTLEALTTVNPEPKGDLLSLQVDPDNITARGHNVHRTSGRQVRVGR